MTAITVQFLLEQAWRRKQLGIVLLAAAGIVLHIVLRWVAHAPIAWTQAPLLIVLTVGGVPLLVDLGHRLVRRELGTDLLAGMAVVTAAVLREYLAGAIIVLMLSGGEALEAFAVRNAASVLRALARRMPSTAHRRTPAGLQDVTLAEVQIGDTLAVLPHEICPVDGVVVEGHGVMDESFLTGEPFHMSKASGSSVISGAINGQTALIITVTKRVEDSRYTKIMHVMRQAEQDQPQLRRLADRLAAVYVPLALGCALAAWWLSGSSVRFLAVLVIATPCPLLIGIPVAILGTISVCARRAIIVKRPVVLEQMQHCRTAIFDKTGTLTYGEPVLAEAVCAQSWQPGDLLGLVASLEQYSKHPLARAVMAAAQQKNMVLQEASEIRERPGEGLSGTVAGRTVRITGRHRLTPEQAAQLPAAGSGGLECVVLVDDHYAGFYRFRDRPREDGPAFVQHLGPRHRLNRILIVSGDRASEVSYLAKHVGITEVFAEQNPEDKLAIVRREAAKARTLFVGDGINDAPALMAATVGIAIGQHSDITSEAAGVVIMDSSLLRVDEVMHLGMRMRRIALQSAVGGMLLSAVGMGVAAAGYLSPIHGALLQEVIDVLAVLNALRTALLPAQLSDYGSALPHPR